MDKVSEHLYISDWYSSINPVLLQKNNIKAVLTIETRFKDNETLKYYKDNGIDYLYLYLHDNPQENIDKYFDLSYKFINTHIQRGENVLVNCWAGVSRSTTLVLHYLLKKGYSYNKNVDPFVMLEYCINNVRKHRPIINPNRGFINQLLNRAVIYQLR
jgi:protein-tyrosine phosphatase